MPYYDNLDESLTDKALGTYENLVHNSIVLTGSTRSIIAVGGVASASPPNRALTSADTRANGTASFAVARPYKSLGLLDFYFGCTIRTGEGAVAVASQCTVNVAGFLRGSNQAAASKSFTFVPAVSPLVPVPMMHAELPKSFQQPLYNVTLTPVEPLVALLIDNLHYTLST